MQKTSKLFITAVLIFSCLILSSCANHESPCSPQNVQEAVSQSQQLRDAVCSASLSNNSEIAYLQQAGAGFLVQGDKIIIAVPTDKLFLVNSSEFSPNSSALLDSLVRLTKQYPNMDIDIIGNTDPIASEKINQQLSTEQAVQVAGYLWSHGVPNSNAQAVSYKGLGESNPIATNEKLSGMAKNRNVMIVIHPQKQKNIFAPHRRIASKYSKTYQKD